MTSSESMDDMPRRPISGYKVYQSLVNKLKQFNAYPLLADNLVVQTDALKRLDPTDNTSWEGFAVLDQYRVENDSSLRFSLTLCGAGFNLSIEGVGNYGRRYDEVAETEDVVAEQLVDAVQMLSSGQIFVLYSLRTGKLCASEIVYRQALNGKYRTLGIQHTDYKVPLGKDAPSAYSWHAARNKYGFPYIPLPKNFFMTLNTPEGEELKLQRDFPGGALSPLTKQMNDCAVADLTMKLTGAKDDVDLNRKLAASWEYWAIILVGMGLTSIFLPSPSLFWALPVAFIVSAIIAHIAVTKLLKFRYRLLQTHTDHLYLHLDAKVRVLLGDAFSTYGLYVAMILMLLYTLFLPLYVTKDTHALVTFAQLIFSGVPVAALPSVGLFWAFVLSLQKSAISYANSMLLAAISVIGVVIVNFALTDTGDNVVTPEPQTSATLLLYTGYLMYAVIQIVLGAIKSRQHKRKKSQSA